MKSPSNYIYNAIHSQAVDTSKYCLGHLFTKRNFGCIVGLGYVGTACTFYTNTAFTVLRKDNVRIIMKYVIFKYDAFIFCFIITPLVGQRVFSIM